MNSLIPFVSTHFRWVIKTETGIMTKDKVYRIEEWRERSYAYFPYFRFKDDRGEEREWSLNAGGIMDCSFEKNLEEILK